MKEVLSREVAEAEVNRWYDAKRVLPMKREGKDAKDRHEKLVQFFQYGLLTLNEEGKITQKLIEPVAGKDGSAVLTELKWRNRVANDSVTSKLRTSNDPDALTIVDAYISAATDQPLAMIGKLDTEDVSISRTLALFFM